VDFKCHRNKWVLKIMCRSVHIEFFLLIVHVEVPKLVAKVVIQLERLFRFRHGLLKGASRKLNTKGRILLLKLSRMQTANKWNHIIQICYQLNFNGAILLLLCQANHSKRSKTRCMSTQICLTMSQQLWLAMLSFKRIDIFCMLEFGQVMLGWTAARMTTELLAEFKSSVSHTHMTQSACQWMNHVRKILAAPRSCRHHHNNGWTGQQSTAWMIAASAMRSSTCLQTPIVLDIERGLLGCLKGGHKSRECSNRCTLFKCDSCLQGLKPNVIIAMP